MGWCPGSRRVDEAMLVTDRRLVLDCTGGRKGRPDVRPGPKERGNCHRTQHSLCRVRVLCRADSGLCTHRPLPGVEYAICHYVLEPEDTEGFPEGLCPCKKAPPVMTHPYPFPASLWTLTPEDPLLRRKRTPLCS